jgi:hypothetical protein
MLKWIGYLLIAAVLIAIATSPSEKKFTAFAYKNVDTAACKPFISHKEYKILFLRFFTVSTVKECKEIKKLQNLQTNQPLNSNVGIPVYGQSKTYVGLFGRFWKL